MRFSAPRILKATWLFCLLAWVGNLASADWPQFRGQNSTGVATGKSPPVEFGPGKHELWRVPLAAGHSSPCIVGNLIFLTTYEEKPRKLAVVCIARASGKIQWQRDVPTDAIEKGHPSFNPASSSPTSDGERVVAYFGSFGLICFDARGNKQWERKMPLTKTYGGNATSPAIIGDRVILYRGNYVDHFLLALDKKTGKELWKVPQREPFSGEMACTSCPIVAGNKLLVHTARSVQAFDISSGKRIWVAKCATTATSTPVVAGNEVIVAAWNKLGEPALRPAFPSFEKLVADHDRDNDQRISRDELPKLWIFHRPEGAEAPYNGATVRFEAADKNRDREIDRDEWAAQVRGLEKFRARYNTHGMLAIRLDSEGLVAAEEIRTLETQGIPEVPSPLCDGTYIYFVKNGGILTCLALKTGKRIYRMRTRGRGTHYASPLIADGKLFTTAGNGRITVLSLGPEPEILAANDMQDSVYATPAIVDGTIYVRTHSALYAFGEKQGTSSE
ncbi:MAG: PQQ-binding-like beta-propeller repeat protein [Pirellulales bacterium]